MLNKRDLDHSYGKFISPKENKEIIFLITNTDKLLSRLSKYKLPIPLFGDAQGTNLSSPGLPSDTGIVSNADKPTEAISLSKKAEGQSAEGQSNVTAKGQSAEGQSNVTAKGQSNESQSNNSSINKASGGLSNPSESGFPHPLLSLRLLPVLPLDFSSWHNSTRYILILLASLSPISLVYRLIPLNSPWIVNYSKFLDKITWYENYKFVFLSYVLAFVLMYAWNYRKMKNPKEIAIMYLQLMILFPLILLFCSVFLCGDNGLDPTPTPTPTPTNPEPASQDSADHSDAPPSNENTDENTATAWYYSKKVWGFVTFGLAVAAVIYYFKGFAPDDMASFNATVSQGVDRISSEQASLGQTLAERVNSAAFQAEILNRNSEGMLSDIALAGEAARVQLEQMTGMTQDLNLLHDRVSTIDERVGSLLRGIVYLISFRWFLSQRVSGSEVNDVFSFSNVHQEGLLEGTEVAVQAATETAEISTHTDEAVVAQTVEISTQTNDLFMDRAYTVLRPAIDSIGETRLLARLRRIINIISGSLSSSDDDKDGVGYVSAESLTQELATGTSTELPTEFPTGTSTELPTGISTVTELPSTSTNPLSGRLESIADYTPRRLDGDIIRVVDNPTYQPTSSLDTGSPSSPLPVDDENPYQFHRHRLYNVKRVFLYLCELLEQI